MESCLGGVLFIGARIALACAIWEGKAKPQNRGNLTRHGHGASIALVFLLLVEVLLSDAVGHRGAFTTDGRFVRN